MAKPHVAARPRAAVGRSAAAARARDRLREAARVVIARIDDDREAGSGTPERKSHLVCTHQALPVDRVHAALNAQNHRSARPAGDRKEARNRVTGHRPAEFVLDSLVDLRHVQRAGRTTKHLEDGRLNGALRWPDQLP